MTRAEQLYLACVAPLGPDGWTRPRLDRLRLIVGDGVPASDRPEAVALMVSAARCLLREGVNDQTHAAVKAAVSVWRKPGGAAAPAVRRDLQ